jgi:hypothetical protein
MVVEDGDDRDVCDLRPDEAAGVGDLLLVRQDGLEDQSVGMIQVRGELAGAVRSQLMEPTGGVAKLLEVGGRDEGGQALLQLPCADGPEAPLPRTVVRALLGELLVVEV